MAALSRRAAFAVPAAAVLVGAAPANPDALLIQRCGAYIAAARAFEAHGSLEDERGEDCPYWRAMLAAEEGTPEMPASTFAGVRAKALVVRFLASSGEEESYSDSICGNWLAGVVQDVLRLTA